jgi:hypothetical protein
LDFVFKLLFHCKVLGGFHFEDLYHLDDRVYEPGQVELFHNLDVTLRISQDDYYGF